MNKKIASELAIGIVLLFAIAIGCFVMKNKNVEKVVVPEIPPIEKPFDPDLSKYNFLPYFGTDEKSSVYNDCQKDEDCALADIKSACNHVESLNKNNSQSAIDDFNLKNGANIANMKKRVECPLSFPKKDYVATCVNNRCNKEIKAETICQSKENPIVYKCGDYYKQLAPIGSVNAPDLLFNKEGYNFALCGGLKTAESNDAKECVIACEQKNLCLEAQKLCTADAKLCSDGSYVSRDGNNNCEFKVCPGESAAKKDICEGLLPAQCCYLRCEDQTGTALDYNACVKNSMCDQIN
jgi:hypothetical protein